jgi:hypothetical protein
MKKKRLLKRIAELETMVGDLQQQLIAHHYAEITRGYPYIAPGQPGYMPAFPKYGFRWVGDQSTTADHLWLGGGLHFQ